MDTPCLLLAGKLCLSNIYPHTSLVTLKHHFNVTYIGMDIIKLWVDNHVKNETPASLDRGEGTKLLLASLVIQLIIL